MLKYTSLDLNGTEITNVTLYAGEFYATNEDFVITTLVGSCIAVCLYDPIAHLAGMDHFLIADNKYARDIPINISEAGRYGVHAMELLINALMKKGAARNRLEAKAFGGGNILDNTNNRGLFMSVGEANCHFIKEFLKRESINLVASDLGGKQGRSIHFYVRNFAVYVRKIKKIVNVVQDEHVYWKKRITEQKRFVPELKIWK